MSTLRNCILDYQCPQRWERLIATDSPQVRYCEVCESKVHWIETEREFVELTGRGLCVAFDDPDIEGAQMVGNMIDPDAVLEPPARQ